MAEESDLIVKLGSYVLARAVREAARWQKELPRPDAPLFVGVNVSSRQLFRPELVKEVRHILGRAVIPRGSLRLEITESLVMENPEKATAVLRELAEAGAGLALDDFGTGYSSLSYLNQFTFDTIKVDRSFLQASGENGTGSVILRSIVALAHELGKNVVVEGIETEDDVGLLRTIGCEYGQGFYYGEPMSEREALQLLKVARRSERRMKRRSLLRKRERIDEETEVTAETASPPPAANAPRTAPTPKAAPAANGAAARVPRTAPLGPRRPMRLRARRAAAWPQTRSALTPASALPLSRRPRPRRPPRAPLQTLPPTPLRSGVPAIRRRSQRRRSPQLRQRPTASTSRARPAAAPGSRAAENRAASAAAAEPCRQPGVQLRRRCRQARYAASPGRSPAPRQANGRTPPDFSKLPPAIAQSLARLAGQLRGPASGQAPPTMPAPAGGDADGKPPAD